MVQASCNDIVMTDPESMLVAAQENINPIIGNTLVYIGGWVVKKLIPNIKCTRCRIALVQQKPSEKYTSDFTLIDTKNNGGLIYPSDAVITTLKHVDLYLRVFKSQSLTQCNCFVIQRLDSSDIFQLGDHLLDTAVEIDNHGSSLMRSVIKIFYDLRQHHRARLYNLQLHSTNIRQKNNKSVLFMGQ